MKIDSRYLTVGACVLAAGVVIVLLASRALPMVDPSDKKLTVKQQSSYAKPKSGMQWSPYGQQAIAVVGSDNLRNDSGKNDKFPIASIAKVMTALVILEDKPLKKGEQGPTMTMTSADVEVYKRELAQNQSVVEVRAGEKMTEYQMLEAMLVPSATNIADSAAVWAFGSIDAYLAKANAYAARLGMKDSHFGGDASGFSPDSYSTPQDLIKLGTEAMANPVIAEIVGKESVELPVAGTINNFNIKLGVAGINGIKTGNTEEAGGAMLFSAPFHDRLIVGAFLGAPNLGTAQHDSVEILQAFEGTIGVSTLLKKDQKVGEYETAWGEKISAVAKDSISVLEWKGSETPVSVSLDAVRADAKSGQKVGTAKVQYEGKTLQSDVVLEESIPAPSVWWRIFR